MGIPSGWQRGIKQSACDLKANIRSVGIMATQLAKSKRLNSDHYPMYILYQIPKKSSPMLECLHNEPFKSLWRPASAKPSILAHCKQAPGAQVHHMLHQDFPNPNSSTASAESQRGAPRSPALRTLRLMVMSRTKKGLVRTFPHHLASPPQRAAQGEVPAQPLEVHGACQEAAAVLGPIHTRPALPVFRAVKEKHKLSEGMGALKVGECLRPGGGVLSQHRRQADGSP